ncbi:MAG TPA: DNA primase [Candidatus Magasanikbacteria bacterium]|jgi:DNA primase|nr:DNA primase [Candidatus Magasanikbacteria bacterium]HQL52545.1 DNA primase [Candidatus Magasanikbacteria bacterium]
MSDEIQQIKDKIDVADLIGEYIQLKPAGANKKGLCPFHNEKTPSFMVSSERQNWHCFGCGKGGDIFSFIQEMEGMEFVEALRYLANRAGIELSNRRSEVDNNQKNRIKQINKEAARFFYNFLIKMSTAKDALKYLEERGIKLETIDEWQIGFIPEQWDLLTQYLLKKGFAVDDLVASGLTIRKEGAESGGVRGFYDRFRGRIMFPIRDVHGEVVGFTGRILVEKENSGGKYVNTPQTIVYDKSRVIFGLEKAKQEIKTKDLVVIVEGQMDAIACHQAGMKNVVASSGTALTEEQIKLLQRYSKNINMAFDVDDAGQNAAKRGIDLAIEAGMRVRVIRIPEGKGKDPDECLKKNPDIWFEAVNNAQDVMDWYFSKVFSKKDITNYQEKQQAVDEILLEIARIPYAVEKDHWLRKLSEIVRVDVVVLRDDLKRVATKKNVNKLNSAEKKLESEKIIKKDPLSLLLERLLALILKYPFLREKLLKSGLEKIIEESIFNSLYELIKKEYTLEEIKNQVKAEDKKNLDILLLQSEWEFSNFLEEDAKKELENIIVLIKTRWKRKKNEELKIKIAQAAKNNDREKENALIAEWTQINQL